MVVEKYFWRIRVTITKLTIAFIIIITGLFLVFGEDNIFHRLFYIITGVIITILVLVLIHGTRFRIKEADLNIIARPFFFLGVASIVYISWFLITEDNYILPWHYLWGTYGSGGIIIYTYYLEKLYLKQKVIK